MTLQERELLSAFLQQMTQAQAGQKDAEADAMIRDASARQPDAAYLLVQRAMGLEFALQATQAQTAKLQEELDQLRSGTRNSFLDAPNAWGRSTPAAGPAQAAFTPAFPPATSAAPSSRPGAPATQAAAAPASAWGSGMLGTVATTAAGVVAGSFLFQGIQGMMGHHNNPAASATPPAPEPVKQAAAPEAPAEPLEEFTDYADAGGMDSGDSA